MLHASICFPCQVLAIINVTHETTSAFMYQWVTLLLDRLELKPYLLAKTTCLQNLHELVHSKWGQHSPFLQFSLIVFPSHHSKRLAISVCMDLPQCGGNMSKCSLSPTHVRLYRHTDWIILVHFFSGVRTCVKLGTISMKLSLGVWIMQTGSLYGPIWFKLDHCCVKVCQGDPK